MHLGAVEPLVFFCCLCTTSFNRRILLTFAILTEPRGGGEDGPSLTTHKSDTRFRLTTFMSKAPCFPAVGDSESSVKG